MKPGQYSEAEKRAILREAEVVDPNIFALCRKHRVARKTFYAWRRRYGKESKELERLRAEITRLDRLLAERDLEVSVLKEALAKIEEVGVETEAWFAT